MNNIHIRQEQKTDYQQVRSVIKSAFEDLAISDKTEHLLVERLRDSEAFVPDLSIVAEIEGKIIGHILISRVKINNAQSSFDALSLAPVSVLPEYQNKGVGSMLIVHAHKVAREAGHKAIVLVGHQDFYPKFGYLQSQEFNITFPFDVRPENAQAIELEEHGLRGVSGCVEYPKEFMS